MQGADVNKIEKADPNSSPDSLTDYLHAWSNGNEDALNQLFPMIEPQLRHIAKIRHAKNPSDTLQPTVLVNEFYFRLSDGSLLHPKNRSQFFKAASVIMERIMLDHLKKRNAEKRERFRIDMPEEEACLQDKSAEEWSRFLGMGRALKSLEKLDPELVQIVRMKYYLGMNEAEIALVTEKSASTLKRRLRSARAFLAYELNHGSAQVEDNTD